MWYAMTPSPASFTSRVRSIRKEEYNLAERFCCHIKPKKKVGVGSLGQIDLMKQLIIRYKWQHTKSTSFWGWEGVSFLEGLSFPDISEPFAGVTSDLLNLVEFMAEGNLQSTSDISIKTKRAWQLWYLTGKLKAFATDIIPMIID